MTKFQLRWVGVLALIGLSIFFLYPSINWYSMDPADRAREEAARNQPRWLLNLGLDLKGGTHLVMEVEADKLPHDQSLTEAVNQAIEVIRNRVDQFGVGETLIARQGDRYIVVQLPGVTDPKAAKEVIGKTALLEFRMVDQSEAAQKALQKIAELGSPFVEGANNAKVKPEVAKLVPKGDELLPGREETYYIVSATAPLTGAHLKDARVRAGGDYGQPVVDFKFDDVGARIFGALTGANVGKNMAIVLDRVVYSAPVIKSRIAGGSGFIEGNFAMEDARALAVVLRAGALPAPVDIIEERTVGPTLGEDSIKSGLRASLIGLGIVMAFMIFYYRASGMVAVLAMILNVLFLLAGMAYMRSTLTLPGIAGVILALAMGIDANVIIFERIREELRVGKPVRIAVGTGYDKAFSAILDAHLAEVISAAFLFQFGTGPIKGFAVTLTLGIAISMLTAIFITKLVFDSYLSSPGTEGLSI